MSTTETSRPAQAARTERPTGRPTGRPPAPTSDARPARAERAPRRRTVARHARCALAGALLAVVAIAALSSYAAQGIADARQAALDRASSHVSAPR